MMPISFFEENYQSYIQHLGTFKGVDLYIKREDLIHPIVSGNKFRKLKYNLLEAKKNDTSTILTFGGAFSNHIAATAEACYLMGLQCIGIIRGEELAYSFDNTRATNSTLKFAHEKGMQLEFVSRSDYRLKENMPLVNVLRDEKSLVFIPEGGTNSLAIKGCKEILKDTKDFDIICSSVGTGGTIAGIIEASEDNQFCIGFSALKGDFLKNEIAKWTPKSNWMLQTDYHFGGYAKVNFELIDFMNTFQAKYKIQLDPIYTGKMFYGLFEMIDAGIFSKNTRILAVHTGGLQGIEGMNQSLKKKGLQTINHL